jgi:ABC-type lipoprotein export system ATPase subunit
VEQHGVDGGHDCGVPAQADGQRDNRRGREPAILPEHSQGEDQFAGDDARAQAIELLKLVRITEPERRMRSYPYELSGGQRQRVMIAMAIANDPDVLKALQVIASLTPNKATPQ